MLPPLKSGQSLNRQWNTVNSVATGADFTRKENLDSRALASSGARDLALDDSSDLFYPFKIYSFPSSSRATPAITSDWLKFRIHGGFYQGVAVTGTDGVDAAAPGTTNYVPGGPDAQMFPSESGTDFSGYEYALDSGQTQIYFWIDATVPTAPVINFGYPGMTVSGNGGDPVTLGWTAFPTPDANHIPIGWVDTSTDSATYWAHIRQLVRNDLTAGGGGGGGQLTMYDTTGGTAYSNGDVVGVAAQFTLSGITVLPGTYMLINGLSTPASPTGNQIPQIPVPTSGTVYWWPIAAGLIQANTCGSGGGTAIYVNSTGTF
jgi:hypothetical protein